MCVSPKQTITEKTIPMFESDFPVDVCFFFILDSWCSAMDSFVVESSRLSTVYSDSSRGLWV